MPRVDTHSQGFAQFLLGMLNARHTRTMGSNNSSTQQLRQTVLERARRFFGYPPNLIVEMSHNVATAAVYLESLSSLRQNGTLTRTEQEIVMLATSAWNACEYCMAAHRTAAKRLGVAQSELDRLSRIELPVDNRLQALATATWALMDSDHMLVRDDLLPFEEFGIEKAQFYEIIALIAVEYIANYVHNIEKTPLDAAIVSQRFRPPRNSDR